MRIEVLGPVRVLSESGDLGARDFRGVKPKQLLQLLVIERGHVVSKARIAELLWPGARPASHLASVESYVSVLRQTLQPGTGAGDSVVQTARGGYRLDLDRVAVDLDDFDRGLEAAARARPAAALELLLRSLSHWRGDVLEDEPDSCWSRRTRDTYHQRRVQALIDAARLSQLTGDSLAAMTLGEQAVTLNPLAESAYQVLMTAAYSLGRQEQALTAFQRCRRLLADELGADPLDETAALHLSILRHERICPVLPPGQHDRSDPPTVDPLPLPLPLLARDRELDWLRAAADRALAGSFTLALVTGDVGLGRSCLVDALARSADLPVGVHRCSSREERLPYLALALALRRVLPDVGPQGLPMLAELLASPGQTPVLDDLGRLRVMESLAGRLVGRTPFLLVLDDAQWADPESLTTLAYLQRRCSDARILVVLTCERGAVPEQPLRGLRPDLRIELCELPREAVEQLGGTALYDATGGNPLYMTSWLEARSRGLAEPFTPELCQRVVARCWDLGPQSYRLLSVASALDEPALPAHLLAEILAARPEDVAELADRLCDQGLLQPVQNGYAFRSRAVRDILHDTLSSARRQLLQQSAAAAASRGWRRRGSDRRRHVEQPAHPTRLVRDRLPQPRVSPDASWPEAAPAACPPGR
jgi:DNA-binding SARP family transcriptional activator